MQPITQAAVNADHVAEQVLRPATVVLPVDRPPVASLSRDILGFMEQASRCGLAKQNGRKTRISVDSCLALLHFQDHSAFVLLTRTLGTEVLAQTCLMLIFPFVIQLRILLIFAFSREVGLLYSDIPWHTAIDP